MRWCTALSCNGAGLLVLASALLLTVGADPNDDIMPGLTAFRHERPYANSDGRHTAQSFFRRFGDGYCIAHFERAAIESVLQEMEESGNPPEDTLAAKLALASSVTIEVHESDLVDRLFQGGEIVAWTVRWIYVIMQTMLMYPLDSFENRMLAFLHLLFAFSAPPAYLYYTADSRFQRRLMSGTYKQFLSTTYLTQEEILEAAALDLLRSDLPFESVRRNAHGLVGITAHRDFPEGPKSGYLVMYDKNARAGDQPLTQRIGVSTEYDKAMSMKKPTPMVYDTLWGLVIAFNVFLHFFAEVTSFETMFLGSMFFLVFTLAGSAMKWHIANVETKPACPPKNNNKPGIAPIEVPEAFKRFVPDTAMRGKNAFLRTMIEKDISAEVSYDEDAPAPKSMPRGESSPTSATPPVASAPHTSSASKADPFQITKKGLRKRMKTEEQQKAERMARALDVSKWPAYDHQYYDERAKLQDAKYGKRLRL